MSKKNSAKHWPKNCVWPEPSNELSYCFCDVDDAYMMHLDRELEDLLEIKEYYDGLVDEGMLDDDYRVFSLYPVLEKYSDELGGIDHDFVPEKGEDYWDNGFDYEAWENDFYSQLSLLKIEPEYTFDSDGTLSDFKDPVAAIQDAIGYEFINENLIRQAFTRRAFGIEYGTGDYENLELVGDSVLSTVVTKEMAKQLTYVNCSKTEGPFVSQYKEGDLSRVREHYVSKDHLAQRMKELGFDKFILYGTGETESDAACEDVLEALIGAVAVDSDWDWTVIEDAVDRLICMNMTNPSDLINAKFYDIFNSWHQKHFGKNPEYEVARVYSKEQNQGSEWYSCVISFSVPEENDREGRESITAEASTRSQARERAAEFAYRHIVNKGLWMDLRNSHIEPDLDIAINQLQELRQKKYVNDVEYLFEPQMGDRWYCSCVCDGIYGWGKAKRKTDAKKIASYCVLVKLMESAGIKRKEWNDKMYSLMYGIDLS